MKESVNFTYYSSLLEQLSRVTAENFVAPQIGETHLLIEDLLKWADAISPRNEAFVLKSAVYELKVGLLESMMGLYRAGFSSLRLCLELGLGSVYFSVNPLLHSEWQTNRYDLKWASLSCDEQGPLSKRCAQAFFPEVQDHVSGQLRLAKQVYRELSEFVHGSKVTLDLTAAGIVSDKELLFKWFQLCTIVGGVLNFALLTRFAKLREVIAIVESCIWDRMGYIPAVRDLVSQQSDS
jgi:hypothetical protein